MVNDATILELVDRIKEFDPGKIILFGSYANGNQTDDSDIDLFVVKDVEIKDVRDMRLNIRKHLWDIIYNQRVPVDLLLDSAQHIEDRIKLGDSIYKEIMTKGRIIYAK
jgi:predicted nucleotidyltransferase